jgi:hypothetical protein
MTGWQHYRDLGQNPRDIPSAPDWVRVSVSGTGNIERYASDSLQLTYQIICD